MLFSPYLLHEIISHHSILKHQQIWVLVNKGSERSNVNWRDEAVDIVLCCDPQQTAIDHKDANMSGILHVQ